MAQTYDFDALSSSSRFQSIHMPNTTVLVASLLFASIALARWWTKRAAGKRPPGPVGEPILGNARQIPAEYSWMRYTELAKQFGPCFLGLYLNAWIVTDFRGHLGDVLYLTAMGQPIVILSSPKAISDLIVKKSAVFSGRPYLAMLGDLYVALHVHSFPSSEHTLTCFPSFRSALDGIRA